MSHKLQHNKVEKHGQFLCANLVGFPWPGHILYLAPDSVFIIIRTRPYVSYTLIDCM